MPSFTVNPERLDPYRSSKFRVLLDGKVVPNVCRISALRRCTETVPWRDGTMGNNFLLAPGQTTFVPLTLERGLTHDQTFENWAMACFAISGDNAMSLKNFRKDMRIDLMNQQGSIVFSFMVYRCWVSEYQALPALDADGNMVAIESLTLQYEGFERDRAVVEPAET